VGVSVGVHHEFNPTLNTLLLAFSYLVEDGMDDSIDAVFPHCN